MSTWKTHLSEAANRLLRPLDIELVRRSDFWRPTAILGRQPSASGPAAAPGVPFLRVFAGRDAGSAQDCFDFAVVMPTTLRETIRPALESVFAQDFDGRVQVLIGVDAPLGLASVLEEVCAAVPDRFSVFCVYPGYSTSRRHGGLHAAWDGGALRTVLSYLANSRYVAYLDDDNWWAADHLSSMRAALEGAEWAWSLRWFVHPRSRQPVCKDEWEAVGPDRGEFRELGGWVDPNCLAIDKVACEAVLPWWAIPLRNTRRAMDADRNVFRILSREFRGRGTGRDSVFYAMDETDERHQTRLELIGTDRLAAARTVDSSGASDCSGTWSDRGLPLRAASSQQPVVTP